MYTKSLIAIAFAGLTAAAPALLQLSSFSLAAIDFDSPIHHKTINANDQKFWVGKPTSSSCPLGILCPAGNVTALTIGSSGYAAMDTLIPGIQKLYIAADGALSYTTPYRGVPAGTIVHNFKHLPESYGTSYFDVQGFNFLACTADDKDIYQIYVNTPGFTIPIERCIGYIAISALNYTSFGAWQY